MEANKANQTLAIPYQTELAKWLEINYKNHHKPTNVDLYNFGVENFSLKNWAKTDEAFSLYAQKFPEQIQGFYFVGIANTKDALNNPAKSLEFFTKATEVGMLNPADSKYFLNQSFYALIKNAMDNKDTAKAKEYASKILTYDPANANANSVLK